MTKCKAPCHNKIPIEFFQELWPTLGYDFHRMILKEIEVGAFHEGITKGLISLITNDGDNRDMNYWIPITLLTTIYKRPCN